MVGIGLETARDDWRALCMNKGCKTSIYLEVIGSLRELDISYSNHVLLGMPFLTPKEAIEDAVATIRFSFAVGAEQVILMVANLQSNTLTNWLWKRRLYDLPKLWAPLQVLAMLEPDERSRIVIKGIDKMIPEPLAYAKNCPKCTAEVCRLIERWNETRDYGVIQKALTFCDCRKAWLREMEEASDESTWGREIYQRIMTELGLA